MSDGLCLRHAFEEISRRDKLGEKVIYVQGVVTHPLKGNKFPHAWIETKTQVIDTTIDLIIPKAKYYTAFNPKDVIRVDPFIAAMLIAKGHRFFTKDEVHAVIERVRKLDEKRKKK